MGGRVDLKEFVAGFILEADEHLHSVNSNLVATTEALKQGRAEPRAVRELFRSLHTIKGLASMVEAEPIVDLAHEMEGILRAADRAGGRISEKALDLLVQGTRAIEERVQAISKVGVSGIPKASTQMLEALALVQDGPSRASKASDHVLSLPDDVLRVLSASDCEQAVQAIKGGKRAIVIEFQPSPAKAEKGLNITFMRERIAKLGELIKVVPRSSPGAPTGIGFSLLLATGASDLEISDALEGAADSIQAIEATEPAAAALESEALSDTEEAPEWLTSDQSSIRVDIRRLDEALERLSELVVTRSKLARVSATLGASGADTRELNAIIAENSRQLKRLRAAITQARMVPLADLFQRLPLVARGLTRDSDKSVNVELQAGTAEVDKAVADRIFPAVVHLVRNAIDHGIEPVAERKLANKPDAATLSVVCDDSSGTSLVVTVSDDGRGIDREAVARKAGRPVAKNDEELLRQIVMPGLSTRGDVTHTSGRGMGMDIVMRAIELLGGTLMLKTVEGKGTTFSIRVPVSVTIVDVLSFVSGDQVYVVPVAMIDEIIEVEPSRLVESPVPGQKGPRPKLIQRRDEAIPLLDLDSLLKHATDGGLPTRALVVNHGRRAIAFGVDRMLGQQEVVVRPLDDVLVRAPGMAGATDLGDGRPTLVLDLATLGATILNDVAIAI